MMSKSKISLVVVLFLAVSLAADDGIIIRKNQRTLEQINGIYSQMDPVRYSPPPYRWKNLPRTRKLLTDRDTLRVVMLGDSIVNDTSRSCWNLLVEKRYPECKIDKITSVRGSTGCWWYKEPGRVRKFVLEHKPSLVMIGGISHRGDIDSIREVIRQIRAASDADILLMTGAFGNVDPRDDDQWQRISDRDHFSEYRKGLELLARGTGAAFVDLEIAWAGYVRESGKDLDFFKRDPIHANERGEQILGHILESYFSLPAPNAASAEGKAG
ncbi:MAG TPA: SGNH/GDSL hydrolase family protein [Sedimentisphaerales bacterium]|nr:SGNH/GDSL hydrolase family protein [Sedimentisphaerales bacterium]